MAAIDPVALLEPITADAPCGPDLDLEGDPDFLGAIARIEGILPTAFFRRDDEGRLQPFDRTAIDFPAETRVLLGLVEQSRDLRALTLLARLGALNRDLAGFAGVLSAVASLLDARWADVHPAGEDGEYALRSATLSALDDMPTVVLPLQHIPLAQSRRLGAITLRDVMIAHGEVAAPEGGTAPDRGTIDRVLDETDLDELKVKRSAWSAVETAAGAIYATTIAKASFEEATNLEKVSALSRRAVALLDGVLAARDPAGLPAPGDGASGDVPDAGPDGSRSASGAPGPAAGEAIAGMAGAAVALASISAYLAAHEPSSPAELLVRQARGLVGKSFLEVLQILVPGKAEEARIGIGADRIVELSFSQLSVIPNGGGVANGGSGSGNQDDDGWGSGSGPSGPDSADAGQSGSSPQAYPVTSRRAARELLTRVIAFYRAAEPSSPIPLLLERAGSTLERDFLAILKEVLPDLGRRDQEGGRAPAETSSW